MSRIEQLGQALAYYLSHPADGIEIGGVSSQLIDIIKIQTKDNKKLRKKVHKWLIYYIEAKDTSVKEYIGNTQAALDDYDAHFSK